MIVARRAAILAAAVILSGCGIGPTPAPTASPAPASTSPQASASMTASTPTPGTAWAINDALRASSDSGLVAALAALPAPSDGAHYAVTAIRQNGDWAVVAISDAKPQTASDTGFALAVRTGGQWTVVLATDTQAFCAALAKAPQGALSQDERDYFMGCN